MKAKRTLYLIYFTESNYITLITETKLLKRAVASRTDNGTSSSFMSGATD